MKLFFVKWKKAVCLSMITVLVLMGVKDVYYDLGQNTPQLCYAANSGIVDCAAQVSGEHDEISIFSCYLTITCSTESMMLKGNCYATVKPTGAEIYRAKVKSNGKNGNFKRIGSCEDFIKVEDVYHPEWTPEWTFNYKDSTVKTGNAYAYKYKVYCKTGGTYQAQEYSKVKKGMAAKTVGAYTCTIVNNTAKKLVVKLTGKSKKNGLLKAQYPPQTYGRVEADLRYKNDGENEIAPHLKFMKYSYNGKKWYTKGKFAIKGKQSVYLYFKECIHEWQPAHNIKVSGYQYAQMFFYSVRYNLQGKLYNCYESPQIRFNLSSGTAAVGDFTSLNEQGQKAFVWDGDIFPREYDDL